MKKISTLILICNFLISVNYAQLTNFNCGCNLTYSPNANLKINGISYLSNNPNNPTTVPTIVLPLGQATYIGAITISQNVACKPIVNGSPTNCASSLAKISIRIQNPNTMPVSGSYYASTNNNYSYTGGLQPGLNTIIVYANCKSGISSGANGQECTMAAFKINVVTTQPNPFDATFSNECYYTVSGPQHTPKYNGNIKFKVKVTSLPPSGTSIVLYNNTAALHSIPVTNISDYFFGNANGGYGTGNYSIKFINNGIELLPTSRTTAYTHNYRKTKFSCQELRKVDQASQTNIAHNLTCLTIQAQVINTSSGQSNGSIIINATLGSAPYQYSKDGTTFQSSNIFNNMATGSYTITVKDAANCTNTQTVTIN